MYHNFKQKKMAKKTQIYNRSLSGSVGAGLGSVFNAAGKRFYVLEHKVSSKYHRAGERQQVIVDQIELGRDSRCQVRFDETFNTVSRRHAAIFKDGDGWKLMQLSKVNSTLLNGTKIEDSWYLQDGDEIQLAMNGPKLGFIVPQEGNGLVKSIGFTQRLNLFRKQALLPYKRALWIILILLILLAAGISGWVWYQGEKIKDQQQIIETQVVEIRKQGDIKAIQDSIISKQNQMIDSLQVSAAEQLIEMNNLKSNVSSVKASIDKEVKRLQSEIRNNQNADSGLAESAGIENMSDISKLSTSIYFIFTTKVEVIYNGERTEIDDYSLSGTGFLLDDGRLVTARHCVEPWYFPSSERDVYLSHISLSGGKVITHLVAISSDGTQLEFTNQDMMCDRKNFIKKSVTFENGESLEYAYLAIKSDWAYIKTRKQGGLKYDGTLSQQLQQGESVCILGFPYMLGVADVNSQRQMQPSYSESKIARSGITSGGVIQLSNKGFEQGNSGGPVFVKRNGEYIVVAIVSHGRESVGLVVPISVMN